MKLLIINADDFGLNDVATEGIVQSFLAGSVTSTTLMVNAPATGQAVALAKRHPALGVGLHFNLTWGRPVSAPKDVPALLAPDGNFLSRPALAGRLLTGRVPKSQIDGELQAQYKRMRDLGLQPTHVDSHQHVHGFGAVFASVASLCAGAGLPMRVPWVTKGDGGGLRRRMRRALLAGMLVRSTRRWQGKVRWNDGLGSVFDLGGNAGPLDDSHYRAILRQADSGTFELMVHPVTDAAAMDGFTRIGAIAETEYRYLMRGTLHALAREEGFVLGNYRDLAQE